MRGGVGEGEREGAWVSRDVCPVEKVEVEGRACRAVVGPAMVVVAAACEHVVLGADFEEERGSEF